MAISSPWSSTARRHIPPTQSSFSAKLTPPQTPPTTKRSRINGTKCLAIISPLPSPWTLKLCPVALMVTPAIYAVISTLLQLFGQTPPSLQTPSRPDPSPLLYQTADKRSDSLYLPSCLLPSDLLSSLCLYRSFPPYNSWIP